MSRLTIHEKKDTVKWWLAGIAIVLILAVLTWLIIAAVKVVNPICLFKHSYNEDNKCIRCGQNKPIENKDEPEQPKAFIAEPYRMTAAAAKRLNASSAGNDVLVLIDQNQYYPEASGNFFGGISSTTVSAFYQSKSLNNDLSINNCRVTRNELITLPSAGGFTIGCLGIESENGDETSYYGLALRKIGTSNWSCQSASAYSEGGRTRYFTFAVKDPGVYQICVVSQDTYYEAIEDENGDEIGQELVTLVARSEIFTVDYGVGVSSLPAAPTKAGYTFTGWYTDEDCTEPYEDEYVTADITLYAGFEANTYALKFNANSGSGSMANLSMTYDQSKTLTANTFTKDHYAFKGWATSANGNVVYSNSQSVKNLTATDGAIVELFAVWERSEVLVSFVVDGNPASSVWIAIGTKPTLPTTPVKEGHTFVCWFLDDGSPYTTQNISTDTTLTAKFEINKCVVTFIVDGEVYATYVCDWGTSLADALKANNVNPVLLKTEDEYSRNF